MVIAAQKVGVLTYSIYVENAQGEVLEQASPESPRTMLFGTGRVMRSFEERLIGLKSGDRFSFVIEPEEAFGAYREELLMEIPKSAFIVNGELKSDTLVVGKSVPMMDSDGNPFNGTILSINGDKVQMDFNHPLAGKSLFTEGEVINVREATYEELNPAPSGCGCGSHNDSCCGGGGHHHDHDHHGHQHDEDDSCGVCGNPAELQGQGIGSCQCN